MLPQGESRSCLRSTPDLNRVMDVPRAVPRGECMDNLTFELLNESIARLLLYKKITSQVFLIDVKNTE